MIESISAAIYIRISQGDKNLIESNSIKNQRELLFEYINNSSELSEASVKEFCDDGYSGTNFERPAFKKLLNEVLNKTVFCILVKDFSRFGRNYIDMGEYIENLFPSLGIRFISVNDNFDSFKSKDIYSGIDIAFKNIFCDLYSKDLSLKVRQSKKMGMVKGNYMGGFVFYGYSKCATDIHKIEIDEYSSKIVKRIFDMVLNGKSLDEIAQNLNVEKIMTPIKYRLKRQNLNKVCENIWTRSTIYKIVTDMRYTGNMIGGKRETTVIGGRKSKAVPKNMWIVSKNTHEAIISENMFYEIQKILSKRNTHKKK